MKSTTLFQKGAEGSEIVSPHCLTLENFSDSLVHIVIAG